jgi:hypothetical protein
MLRKIITGGQTGADRAGLDFAIETGLEHGGYVPRGRKAEDGRIDDPHLHALMANGPFARSGSSTSFPRPFSSSWRNSSAHG